MRRALFAFLIAVIAALAYPASGFRAAWEIREALRLADVETLRRRVDWEAVRTSLKQSTNETRSVVSEMSEAAGVAKPGLWQRLKSAALPFVADPLIDRYVTAEGAPQIWSWRQTWREKIRPTLLTEPQTPLASTWLAGTALDRGLDVARRIKRATFTSPTRLEVVLRDRYTADRRWRAALELRGFAWVLTDVQVQRRATTSGLHAATSHAGATRP